MKTNVTPSIYFEEVIDAFAEQKVRKKKKINNCEDFVIIYQL